MVTRAHPKRREARGGTRTQYETTEGHHRADRRHGWPWHCRDPASAELHSVTVVLITGERIEVTVDVPPGTPASQIQIPGITGTITQVIDNGAISTPTPNPTPALPVPTVSAAPRTPTPTSTPTPDGNEKPGAPNRTQGGSDPGQFHART